MHDRNGTQIMKGDRVMIEAKVTDLYEGDDYCNVQLKTLTGRRPDNQTESLTISSVNTGVLVVLERGEIK